jgi:uncharacterized protein involved in exopolysaccharide biosynthesis
MTDSDFLLRRQESTRYATLRDWCAVGFRRRRIVLVSFFGLLLGTVLFSVISTSRYYESSMQILVLQDRSDPAVTAGPNAAMQNTQMVSPDQINSEMALLKGADVLRQVAINCGLAKKKGLTDFLLSSDPERRELIKVEKQAKNLAKAIRVDVEKQADMIDVSYGSAGAPETPFCVLDNLSKLYLQKHLQTHRPAGSSDVFTTEAEKYRQALLAVEVQLVNFGPSEGVVAPDVQRTLVATKLVDTEGLLNQAKAFVAGDEQRIANLDQQLKTTAPRMLTQETDQDAGALLQQLHTQLLAAEFKRTQLLMKYDASYPLAAEAEEEVAQAKAAIADAEKSHIATHTTDQDPTYLLLREDLAKTKADLATEQATASALAQSIRAMQLQTVQLDQKSIKQQDLLREAKADESNYLLYLAKREQERSSDAMDRGRIANVSLAVAPTVPLLPANSPLMVIVLGFIFSVFASLGAGFLAEYLDPSFRTPTEVAEVLHIPVVASVPRQAA